MAIAGGAWTNENSGLNEETGWCSVPHFGQNPESGAQVFVFFEAGNINKPVYFAAAQSGPGWLSEHPNQHVFHSDNIRVRIDEEPTHPNSTCQFDSYNDKNCQASIQDKTKKGMKTRLDIEILAEDLNAVNVQIHGDVNMKVLGDWYVHHEGSKHETHIGPTYIKHIGNTIIEEEGEYIYKHTGNHHNYVNGLKNETITGNYTITCQQEYKFNAGRNAIYNIGGDTTTLIGGIFKSKVIGAEEKILMGGYTTHIGGDLSIDVRGNTDFICGGHTNIKTVENAKLISQKGNIDITTNGEFELLSGGNITPNGYKNIGTKGNIRITSTFGNIGIKTIENKYLADFEQEYTCIAWNPSYLKQMSILSNLPGFDEDIIFQDIDVPTDFTGIISFLQQMILYDGFPSFLPCKMILQNPNISAPTEPDWIKNFRSIDENWNNISNTAYWKLLGKLMGNIEISSWNGDISMTTTGTLGNAGNINIFARNKYGVLPGYQAGNVKIAADTPFRIYTDPRDLFLDTDLMSKLTGKLVMFSSANGVSNTTPTISIKPFSDLQSLLGPFEFGFTQKESNGGGCIQCICDVLVSVLLNTPAINSIYCTKALWKELKKDFIETNGIHLHSFNTISGALIEPKSCASINLLEQTSNGFGHAIDKFNLGQTYEDVNYPLGDILINGVGSYKINAGKNFEITAATKNWNFGVNYKTQVGYIEPNEENINFGDTGYLIPSVFGFPTPVAQNYIISYKNEYNGKKFGNYIAKYNANMKSGIYPLGIMGCLGYEDSKYDIQVPSLNVQIIGMNLLLSPTSIDTHPYNISNDFYSVYQPTGIKVNEDITIGKLQNSYKIKLGNETIGTEISGKLDYTKFEDDLPNTAKAVETAGTVVSLLSKVIPGIGDAASQAIKMLPEIQIPKFADTVVDSPYLSTLSGGAEFNAFLLTNVLLTGGTMPFPSSLPLLNIDTRIGLPNFAKEIDQQLSMGNILNLANPTELLESQIDRLINPLEPFNNCEARTKVGAGIPKPIGNFLEKIPGGGFDNPDFWFLSGGLSKGATIGGEIDYLNGLMFNGSIHGAVPLTVEDLVDKPSFEFNAEVLKTGPYIYLSPLQSELSYNIFDKTCYTNVKVGKTTGFTTSINIGAESKLEISTEQAELKLLGLQIFKIPDLLGKALIDAIRSVFGL